ncbi:hypothetical protein [Parasphingopyxis marina]|uniref:Uncharacterized protein n=1 Tax=Parasphingopyxis marina TaxID=2761622 RepID=A0A842HXN8_9SPHN|nr:hypothetical protein [Parasphingopyxis marina]MBC2777712.1 hypothetical protein [Parasphingopyxis marina]
MAEQGGSDEYKGYDDFDPEWDIESGGRPGLAAAICAILVLTSTCTFDAGDLANQQMPIAYMAGRTIGFGAVAWGIAYAITIRKASRGWIFGSLAIVIGASLIALLGHLVEAGSLTPDHRVALEGVAESMEAIQEGAISGDLPTDRSVPGLTRLFNAYLNSEMSDANRFHAEAEEAGLVALLNFENLTPDNEIFGKCDAMAALADRASYYGGRAGVHRRAAQHFGLGLVREGALSRRDLDQFVAALRSGSAQFERVWELNSRICESAAAACHVLARGRWEYEDRMPYFTSDADLEEYNRHIGTAQGYQIELQRIGQESADSMREIARTP